MRFKIKQLSPALAVAAVLIAIPAAGRASADTTTALPQLGGFHQMVVDVPAGYVFLSEGANSGALVNGDSSTGPLIVTDLTGKYVATVDNGDGVEGLALSPDGKTLYAALAAKQEVDAIDVSTITTTPTATTYPLGTGETPIDLALQSGKLWVSYNTSTTGAGGAVGDIDISAASPAFTAGTLPQPSSSWYSAPQIAGDPNDGGVLVAGLPASSNTAAASYNVAGSSPALTAQTTALGAACGNLDDLAVLPGGVQFIAACNTSNAHTVYSTAGLSVQTSYPAAASPDAVAIAADGTIAAGAAGTSSSSVHIYNSSGTLRNSISVPAELAARGLAWPADVSKLYAVQVNGNSYSLDVYNTPTLTSSTLSLSGPKKFLIGKSYTISGKLTFSVGTVPTGTAVKITRTKPGTTTMHWTRQTATDGTFTLSNKPPAWGTYTYTAAYAGSSTTQSATAAHKVMVNRLPVSLWIKTSANKVRYNGTVKVTAHLGKTHNRRIVSIYARTVGSKKRVLLKRGSVNSHGYLTVKHRIPHSTVFSAVFSGDARYRPRTVSHTVGAHVKVAVNYTGYYTSTRSGGKTYHVFHHNAYLKAAVRVTPNKHGQCVKLQTQEFYYGAWLGNTVTSCGYLGKNSTIYGVWGLTHADRGYHYRTRVKYLRKNTDHSNLSTTGSWFYFIVRK